MVTRRERAVHCRRRGARLALVVVVGLVASSCLYLGGESSVRYGEQALNRPVDLALGDVTGSGREDPLLLLIDADGDRLVRFEWCGVGCLVQREHVVVGGAGDGREIAVADFDEDGTDDVAVVTDQGTRLYFGGQAGPGRSEGLVDSDSVAVSSWGQHVLVGDENGDGHADLYFTSHSGPSPIGALTVTYAPGDGTGGFGASQSLLEVPWGPGTTVSPISAWTPGDFDGDGSDELAVHYSVSIDGPGGGAAYAYLDVLGLWSQPDSPLYDAIAAADLDGDGRDDLAALPGGSSDGIDHVELLRSTGTALEPFDPPVTLDAPSIVDITLSDADHDGEADAFAVTQGVGSNPDQWAVSWWNGGPASPSLAGAVRLSRVRDRQPGLLVVGDATGDGLDDVVSFDAGALGSIFVYETQTYGP